MMRAVIASLWVLGIGSVSLADQQLQNARSLPCHYYYFSDMVDMELDVDHVAVRTGDSLSQEEGLQDLLDTTSSFSEAHSTGIANWHMLTLDAKSVYAEGIDNQITATAAMDNVEFASPVFRQGHGTWSIVTPDILVGFAPEYASVANEILDELTPELKLQEVGFGGMASAYRLHSPSKNGFDVLAQANRLAEDPRIEWAEPDFQTQITLHLTPNDLYYTNDLLWGLHNFGQFWGVADIDMNAPEAWDAGTGSPDIKVLVLDSGVQQDHPDINQAAGADFTGEGGGGGPVYSTDVHGTAVAGCVSAIINNSIGVVGIAPGCRVISGRFAANGTGFQLSWLTNAINWGVNQGARCSVSSFSMDVHSSVSSAYNSARSSGMVHFASSGNEPADPVGYPATLASVNAIGGVHRDGTVYGSYGSELAFTAPAHEIYTTDRTGVYGYTTYDYAMVQGTSFSCPYAAGVAALFLSHNPSLTPAEVEAKMRDSAKDLGATGFDSYFGWGLVNAISTDCNDNGIHDDCDVSCDGDCAGVAGCGSSQDCQPDGIPDECQLDGNDCNDNDVPDDCEVLHGSSDDCNNNSVPDECELDGNDCNGNYIPDECDQDALIPSQGQPLDVDVCSNGTATFVVADDGASPYYQWYKDSVSNPLSDIAGLIEGSQEDTLVIYEVTDADDGEYFCRVTDGCIETDSRPATLGVIVEPIITQHSNSTATCEGGSVSFTIDHNGRGVFDYAYTWTKDGLPLASQPGGRTLNLTDVAVPDSGDYVCRIYNSQCDLLVESPAMTLTVLGAVFTVQPAPQCRNSSEVAILNMAAESPGEITGYVWQKWYDEPYNRWINVNLQSGDDIQPLQINPPLTESSYRGGVYIEDACWSYTRSVTIQLGYGEADLDGDGDVDLADMATFVECFGVDSSSAPECGCANLSWTNRVIDLDDWTAFEANVTGP